MSSRKLPKWARILNLIEQFVLGLIALTNTIFIGLQNSFDIPKAYYEVCAILLAAIPVFWTNFLDTVKKYQNDATPPLTPLSPASLNNDVCTV